MTRKQRLQRNKRRRFWQGLRLGVLTGYIATELTWAFWQLASKDVTKTLATQTNEAPKGQTFSEVTETDTYIKTHAIEDGIERIVYTPKERRFETPIVMQHGMWHGAWCWSLWQALFAEWGWETHAHSLPGHGRSPLQRPIASCTLDYYLSFLKTEVARQPRPPILMGHSMGGALTQWYLKYVGDDLPATVLVAPWISHSMVKDAFLPLIGYDPVGIPLMMLTWDATPMVRDAPGSAVRFLVGPDAVLPLHELQPKLGPESVIVMLQHNPPFWHPPENVRTPMLWIAGGDDPLLTEAAERASAVYYKADYMVAERARHNVMHEHNYRETAESIHHWLVNQGIP